MTWRSVLRGWDEPDHLALKGVDLPFANWTGTRVWMTRRRLAWGLAAVVAIIPLAGRAHAGVACFACICTGQDFASACRLSDPFSTTECDAVCGAGKSMPHEFDAQCSDLSTTRCPTSEAGYCADGINNDAYRNDLTDCDDPACATSPSCYHPAPVLSETGLVLVGILLLSGGVWLVRRRGTDS